MLSRNVSVFAILTLLSITLIWNGYTAEIQFVDVTEEAGIHFKHAGGIDLRVVPALVGSGAAWRDYDNNCKGNFKFNYRFPKKYIKF